MRYTFRKGSAEAVDIRETYGVYVESATGLIGKPQLKTVDAFDWKYLHGTTPDLINRRYGDKEITLSCWMKAVSKQQLVERLDAFMRYFDHDDLLLMKVTWETDNDNGGLLPNPHAAKGLFAIVWLKSCDIKPFKWHKGTNIVKFTMTFHDPYPVKRVYRYGGAEGEGVEYDIVSDTEIDIFTEDGSAVYDIKTGSGHIDVVLNRYIIVCGDVSHAEDSNGGSDIITPTNHIDTVTEIYNEI